MPNCKRLTNINHSYPSPNMNRAKNAGRHAIRTKEVMDAIQPVRFFSNKRIAENIIDRGVRIRRTNSFISSNAVNRTGKYGSWKSNSISIPNHRNNPPDSIRKKGITIKRSFQFLVSSNCLSSSDLLSRISSKLLHN